MGRVLVSMLYLNIQYEFLYPKIQLMSVFVSIQNIFIFHVCFSKVKIKLNTNSIFTSLNSLGDVYDIQMHLYINTSVCHP